MKMIRPLAVTDANLLATNVPETVATWLSNVTYAAGAVVRFDATHRLYESAQGGNLGHPVDDPAWWIDLGPTNPWAMFDQVNGTQTANPTNIEATLSFASPVNSIALINLEAESVTITGREVVNVAPRIVSGAGATVTAGAAASTVVYTAVADETVTWALAGTDAALFSIDADDGELRFLSAPAAGSYAVDIIATDAGGLTDTLAVTITASAAAELPPSITSAVFAEALDGAPASDVIYTATANKDVSWALREAFEPELLFTGGEQGAFYDPSDLSSMSQNSDGTGAAAVGSPVGRIMDKSGRGNHATQATAAARPILRQDSGGRYYLEFDGVDDIFTRLIGFVGSNFTRISALRQISWTLNDYVFQGSTGDAAVLYQSTGTPQLRVYHGTGSDIVVNGGAAVGANAVVTETFSATQMRIAVNEGAYVSGVAPSSTPDRISIGGGATVGRHSHIRLYGVCMIGRALADGETQQLRDWMSIKAGLASAVPAEAGDEALFSIDATTGEVRFLASPDFETKSSYAINVHATALNGLTASQEVTISVTEPEQPAYDRTFSLASDSGVADWYAYFYEEIVRKTVIVATDLPPITGMEIDVTIRGTDVAVGTLVAGSAFTIGQTEHGASVGIRDFSRKETDDFGNFMVVERAFSKRGSFKVWCDTARVDAIADVLPRYRATPIVWIAAEAYRSTVIYGFYRDWTVEIAYPTQSICTLEIEGLS